MHSSAWEHIFLHSHIFMVFTRNISDSYKNQSMRLEMPGTCYYSMKRNCHIEHTWAVQTKMYFISLQSYISQNEKQKNLVEKSLEIKYQSVYLNPIQFVYILISSGKRLIKLEVEILCHNLVMNVCGEHAIFQTLKGLSSSDRFISFNFPQNMLT